MRTRSQTIKSTTSCRIWQLIYCITSLLREPRSVAVASKVLMDIHKNPVLNTLIYLNNPLPREIELCYSARQLKRGNTYMCIYIDNVQMSIIHYFTVIDGMYLNSSYCSDYVCVPEYTTRLVRSEFVRFVNALNTPGNDEDYIAEFYQKYFLSGNLGVACDYENDPSLRFKKWSPNEGNAREIAYITQNLFRSNIRCGIMINYEELVSQSLQSSMKCFR